MMKFEDISRNKTERRVRRITRCLARNRQSMGRFEGFQDLLHEIDECLTLARGFLFAKGGGIQLKLVTLIIAYVSNLKICLRTI